MPLKVVVGSIHDPEVFEKTVEETMQKVEQDFAAFNKQHRGKAAQVSRSVTFHATESHLVCILYFFWALADAPSGLLVPAGSPRTN